MVYILYIVDSKSQNKQKNQLTALSLSYCHFITIPFHLMQNLIVYNL